MSENKNEKRMVEVPLEAPPINAATLTRLVLFVAAIINTMAAFFGFDINLALNGDVIYEGFSIFLNLIVFGAGFWKNNDMTKKARISNEAFRQVKDNLK